MVPWCQHFVEQNDLSSSAKSDLHSLLLLQLLLLMLQEILCYSLQDPWLPLWLTVRELGLEIGTLTSLPMPSWLPFTFMVQGYSEKPFLIETRGKCKILPHRPKSSKPFVNRQKQTSFWGFHSHASTSSPATSSNFCRRQRAIWQPWRQPYKSKGQQSACTFSTKCQAAMTSLLHPTLQ